VPSDEDGTKNGVPSEYRFAEGSEYLSEISQSWIEVQSTSLAERQVTEAKLKQVMNNADLGDCDQKKQLAALNAASDGEVPSIINPGNKNSSIIDILHNNYMSDPVLNICVLL
jgi:hypothetical protein